VQFGLRGYWPSDAEFAWQAEHGITSLFMRDVREQGLGELVRKAIEIIGADLVEVIPVSVGSAETAPLVGERIVREILTAIAIRRRAGARGPG
jgi:arginase family enzyme